MSNGGAPNVVGPGKTSPLFPTRRACIKLHHIYLVLKHVRD